jgi:hypothetical protein
VIKKCLIHAFKDNHKWDKEAHKWEDKDHKWEAKAHKWEDKINKDKCLKWADMEDNLDLMVVLANKWVDIQVWEEWEVIQE